jgi:hypothetical protein
MSTDLDTLSRLHTTARLPRPLVWLAALLGLLAIGAFQGGLTMVRDPLEPLGLQVDFLARTPIDTYFWPGVFLLCISAACLVTVTGLVSRWRWQWAVAIESRVGYRWPWIGAVSIGVTLLVFEMLEVYMVPFHPLMHPLLIAASVAVLLLASVPSTRAHLQADQFVDHR